MEMNFPHESLKLKGDRNAAGNALQQTDHNALLAHVIARQSLSHSAQAVVAHQLELATAIANNKGRSLENRIRFFAAKLVQKDEFGNSRDPFVRGHFRPDLAERYVAGGGV